MAVARMKFLANDEMDLIDQQSIECLATIGVKVKSPSVLKMLGDAGANIDTKTQIAKIPESMVRGAIRSVPKETKLCGRNPKHDMRLPVDSWPYMGTNGLGTFIPDIDTGKNRDSVTKDIADCVKLADALDGVSFVQTSLTATDAPHLTHGLHELWTAFQNTTKHVHGVEIFDAEDARKQIELGALVAGGADAMRKKPSFSVIHCSIAPLMFERDAVEAMVEFAKAGAGITTMSMSLSGGTAPVTMAGTIVNANSENLASLVICQTASKGARSIYCSSSAPIDMSTGMINYMSPNHPLIQAGLTQMAKRYGLLCMAGDYGLNESDKPGLPQTFSESLGIAVSTMGGTDMCCGIGSLDNAKGMSLEQIVIDTYVWENIRKFMTPFEISKGTAALDIIRQVGHGNTFLQNVHTAKNFRKEIILRDPAKGRFEATLSRSMVSEARKIARKLLKEHHVEALDRTVVKEGDAIIRGFEKERMRKNR